MNRKYCSALLAGTFAFALGCTTEAGVGPNDEEAPDGITFSFASPSAASGGGGGASANSSADPETFTDGTNTLVISKLEVVLGELELERTEFVDCAANPEATTCGDFKVGPLVIDVPLGDIARQFTLDVDPGEYNAVEIEVHRLDGNLPDDAAILLDRPELDGQSIRIEGTYNGEDFVFMTDLSAFTGYAIDPPIVIDETNPSTNVTVLFDLDSFFRDQAGALVNPAEANEGGQYEDLVENNITTAIECFQDQDEDGEEGDPV